VGETEVDSELLDLLAEEFLDRLRRGERPLVSEYTARYPSQAEEIRQLLSALALVEDLKPRGDMTADHADGRATSAVGSMPERLGEFRILREIGRGGMGIVYEAEQESLSRRVALKVLPSQVARTPQQIQRFLREARSAAQLHHTNIVPVFGVGEYNGLYYYAMQFIDGPGLDSVLEEMRRLNRDGVRNCHSNQSSTNPDAAETRSSSVAISLFSGRIAQPEPAREANASTQRSASVVSPGQSSNSAWGAPVRHREKAAAKIGLQVAEALEHAHQQGTLHRDIKPSNILLDDLGTAWVTDFGLAKAAEDEDLTRTGDFVGTLRYMAPERLRGRADARSDVYALGLTLYEVLALRPAFDTMDQDNLIYQVMHTEPPQLCRFVPALSRDLETIVHKAIEKNSNDRYQTAAMMAEDLRCFLDDQPIGARRVGSTERLARWARRNPWFAGLCVAVTVLLAVIAAGATVAAIHLQRKNELVMTYFGQALEAKNVAGRRLAESLLAQSRASRRRIGAGRRYDALAALNGARDLVTDPDRQRELRDEAVACFALTDLVPGRRWHDENGGDWRGLDFDAEFARYALADPNGDISLRDVRDDRELARLPGSGLRAVELRFSPDGSLLAAKYENEEAGWVELCVWDLEKRSPMLRVADGLTGTALDFGPDSQLLAAARRDGSISFIDLGTGREVRRAELGCEASGIRFDSSGRRLAVAHLVAGSPEAPGPSVEIVEARERGKPIVFMLPQGTYDVQWSTDGQVLAAAGSDGIVYLLDPEQRKKLRVLTGHHAAVVKLSAHPDGDLLASGSWDGTLRLWSMSSGEELVRAPIPISLIFKFSRDGRFLGPGYDGASFWFWDVTIANTCRRLVAPEESAMGTWGVSFHPDVDLLASAGPAGVRLAAPRRGQVLAFLNLPGTNDAFFDADGRNLITSGASGLLRWPLSMGSSASGTIRLGPAEPLGPARGLPTGRVCSVLAGSVMAIAIDRELGQTVIEDRSKPGWRVNIQGHEGLERVALSPDGRWLATGTWKGTGVKIWDTRTAKLERTLPVESSADVTFSPDGKELVTASGHEYCFWDVGTWSKRISLGRQNAGGMPGKIVFSPGARVAALTRTRDLVELIDPVTGTGVARLELPDSRQVAGLGFSPDGGLLAVTYRTNSIRIWDLNDLRRRLADLDLDWDEPSAPSKREEPLSWISPAKIEIELPAWLVAIQKAAELATQGRYVQAAEAYEIVMDANAATPDVRYRQALLFLAMGRIDDYRRICKASIDQFGEDVPPPVANTLARTLVLGPHAAHDPDIAVRLARRAIAGDPSSNRINTLGGALSRAGHGPEAVATLLRAIATDGQRGTPLDWVLLALSFEQQGRRDEAHQWLDRVSARDASPATRPGEEVASWAQRLQLQLLRAEVEARLSGGMR
jgi:serine/threonine protein kinase/WD40 repeat protein